ncbi:MAG: serine/threonine-protein phosphatase [Lentisphaeria bacterium]|nr:serine/threonine-protein phosphatase [Lentisphaeria bacterium]
MKNNARLVEFAGESNTGLLRHSNEDHFLVCQLHGTEMALAVVSDGIGGHSKGEIASMICCRELFHAALELKSDVDAGEFFRRQLLAVNRKLFERNYREARRRPMGCTAVAALFDRDKITVASVGDSRFYKYSVPDGTLTQITRDHRPDEAMLENIAALYHQDKEELRSRLLLNALGTKYAPEVDIFHLDADKDALYLLCSDGLTGQTPDSVISRVLAQPADRVRSVTSGLIREALLHGARDNVTVVCARYK